MSIRLAGGRFYNATRSVEDIQLSDASGGLIVNLQCRGFNLALSCPAHTITFTREEWDMLCNDVNTMMGWEPGDV